MIKITFDNVQIGNTIILAFGSERYMKLDIPYYIRQVLREQRMVYVPDIGTFYLNQTSASFNDDKTNITPPSLDISFDDSKSNDDSLLKYILDAGHLTEDKAKNKIAQYTQSAFNKLLNVDAFEIEGVGIIAKRSGNDKVEFEPKLSALTREFNDLVALKLTPVSRIAEQVPNSTVGTAPVNVEESESFLPRILIFTLLLIGAYFLGTYLYNNYINQPDNTEIIMADEEPANDVAAISESNEADLEKKYNEIDELIDPLSDLEKENANTNNAQENIADSKPEVVIENPVVEKEAVDEVVEKGVNIVVDENAEAIEENTQDDNKPINKYSDIIPETGECIIVVGSFIKSLNAIKMVSLLERKGYEVYRSEYKGFTRVGLKYECVDEDLEAYLQEVRNKISKRAWYLDPELKVPYGQ